MSMYEINLSSEVIKWEIWFSYPYSVLGFCAACFFFLQISPMAGVRSFCSLFFVLFFPNKFLFIGKKKKATLQLYVACGFCST